MRWLLITWSPCFLPAKPLSYSICSTDVKEVRLDREAGIGASMVLEKCCCLPKTPK